MHSRDPRGGSHFDAVGAGGFVGLEGHHVVGRESGPWAVPCFVRFGEEGEMGVEGEPWPACCNSFSIGSEKRRRGRCTRGGIRHVPPPTSPPLPPRGDSCVRVALELIASKEASADVFRVGPTSPSRV